MAFLETSEIIQDIRGSVGNHIFRRGGSGHTVYAKSSRGRRTHGAFVHDVNQRYSEIVTLWHGLTRSQKEAWNNYADRCMGFQEFMRVNQHLKSFGFPNYVTVPPVPSDAVVELVSLTLTYESVPVPRLRAIGIFTPPFDPLLRLRGWITPPKPVGEYVFGSLPFRNFNTKMPVVRTSSGSRIPLYSGRYFIRVEALSSSGKYWKIPVVKDVYVP